MTQNARMSGGNSPRGTHRTPSCIIRTSVCSRSFLNSCSRPGVCSPSSVSLSIRRFLFSRLQACPYDRDSQESHRAWTISACRQPKQISSWDARRKTTYQCARSSCLACCCAFATIVIVIENLTRKLAITHNAHTQPISSPQNSDPSNPSAAVPPKEKRKRKSARAREMKPALAISSKSAPHNLT